jgi:predicted DNA-binding protein
MLIRDAKPNLAESKELKVRIPVEHHLRLHAMRVMTGKGISQAMIEALDAYFAEHPQR